MNVCEHLLRMLDGDDDAWVRLRHHLERQVAALVSALAPDAGDSVDQSLVVNRAIDRIRGQLLRARVTEEYELDQIVISCSRRELVAALADGAGKWMLRALERQLPGGLQRPQAKFSPSEVWQQTQLTALRSADLFVWHGAQAFRGWLRAIARNEIRRLDRHWGAGAHDIRRELPQALEPEATSPLVRVPSADPSPSVQLVTRDTVAQVLEAMDDSQVLSADQRVALHLRYVDGIMLSDVATTMDRSLDAVKMLISRGIANLRCHLRHNSFPLSDAEPAPRRSGQRSNESQQWSRA